MRFILSKCAKLLSRAKRSSENAVLKGMTKNTPLEFAILSHDTSKKTKNGPLMIRTALVKTFKQTIMNSAEREKSFYKASR